MSLRYDNVSYTYPGTSTGVFDISLEIGRGELLAIIGASGSGKSTVLKLLAGFVQPSSGRVLIDGDDVSTALPEARRLGVVFQNYALFPHMRLWENVAYPLKVRGLSRGERRERAAAMLQRVGMGNRVDDFPAALSGGQQQRVALARALVFEPRGLLLDEPLSALDAGLRMEMRDEILRVQRAAGIATLLVTHDQEEALSIADKVAVMRDGRLIQVGPPRALYETPVNADVAAFVGQSNLWPGRVTGANLVGTALGPLACDTGDRAIGDAVTVFVRPERVTPVDEPATAVVGQFTGTVVADRYLGPVRRIDLDVGGGVIKLETHLREPVTSVAIPPDAVRLLPAGLQNPA
ncbi:ABC transporter ATP-binding protein [Bradyrhizobium sp. U87765 SZCCT0131]|uniref:ABC transporter ATP-binding protein n=1 Tax=unclassified Bradyrhizobium TaxID=2631580 RepID=UPI001BA85045|nr:MULTISPECIES: ABC transporter ATP-binding protein [unclassified Bradyrhizobium]MBR1216884.1 ABC transporter ATP-binding protein [Bradyrhizobium sp. U87765 SZCCT0131]MBR1259360.1 ABC transporter ATP-binding protein [Bradyrhizobium sp. U87765 SZCCT0134]MBR1305501.1 ABC transporter ATP-binding protein [Bradyrhizobium sp. U87765 SZCCT0110]MBR1321868.1 ABC transporter ATP-binding protein [Bradyrhizobium sp. U87765 SZCCT0109]MBR1350854.1 ABC transporter ATP-binding protein [Bradyrhizobium sp. U87